ncbi:MAG TPA: response regulator [Nitrososphaeraceae archaeon]
MNNSSKPMKSRIMTVDDEPDVAITLRAVLQESGLFEVDSFTDPQEALSSFAPRKYDLVILDIRMPKMDGFDFYRKIRALDKEISVCFLTAVNNFNEYGAIYPDIVSKIENDVDTCVIDKPADSKQLIEKIMKVLKIAKES